MMCLCHAKTGILACIGEALKKVQEGKIFIYRILLLFTASESAQNDAAK